MGRYLICDNLIHEATFINQVPKSRQNSLQAAMLNAKETPITVLQLLSRTPRRRSSSVSKRGEAVERLSDICCVYRANFP